MVLSTVNAIIAFVFAVAHSATGLFSLLMEKDLAYGLLTDDDTFEPANLLPEGSLKKFLRGPKINGRGTAPNVRAWGARQLAIGCVFWWAVYTQETVAYMGALIALLARATGDAIQNLFDGCYWKVGLFLSVETMVAAVAIIYM